MKLVINFDLINAILNVNEGLTPMKIVRNNKRRWATLNLPLYLGMDAIIMLGKIKPILDVLAIQLGALLPFEILLEILFSTVDIYKMKSIDDLKNLVIDLNNKLYVNTDYDLLLQSELISKNYKIHLNENYIPSLLENKYILVPTYDFNGNVKNTNILQEHEVGTKDYVLSIGSPRKELKLAYASK